MSDKDKLKRKLETIMNRVDADKEMQRAMERLMSVWDQIEDDDDCCDDGCGHDDCDDCCDDWGNDKDQCDRLKLIISLLQNKKFGLKEIKCEIKTIESTVLSPTFGLAEIKREIRGLESAVAGIETTLLSPTFGLPEIKSEIRTIESTILSPTFGLEEIKREIRGLESAVAGIETTLLSPTFGLPEIKSEIRTIESTILSPTFGLEEIKKEVREILASITTCNSNVRTTGPVIADCKSNNLIGKVLNNTVETRTIVVTAFNLETCPKRSDSIATLVIPPKCARAFDFRRVPEEYEVQVSGVVPGVLIFSSTTSCDGCLNSANTFRDSEFVCSSDPDCLAKHK